MQFDQRTIFPDTNIFLHYPPLDQIDWSAVAGAANVELVVCLQVLSELDAKKSDARLANRAERSLRQIRELRDKAVRDGVVLSVFNEQVRREDFPPDMDPELGDDRILRQVQRFVEKNPERHVAVVTADYGMALRCEAFSVDALTVDAELRLSVPEDEQQKKYRQAVEEAHRLKNKRPDLSVLAVPSGTDETY